MLLRACTGQSDDVAPTLFCGRPENVRCRLQSLAAHTATLLPPCRVARDAEGFKFNHGGMPYVREPFAEQRIWQGLPFPVSCCWNGMAVLSAAPFQNGTRFRADDPEGCPSSECSLICDDFIRAGHTKMVVDPGGQGSLNRLAGRHGAPARPAVSHVERCCLVKVGTVLLRAAPDPTPQ